MITLQQLHDAEISGQIDWLYDTAWHVEIGKPVLASATVSSEAEALEWLRVKAKELFGWEPEKGRLGLSGLERAIAIAAEAHAGQKDRGGQPYILHPLRVMAQMDTERERIVAVLHDVVEDCPEWPAERLAAEGFDGEVLAALDSVTKRGDETYDAFIARAAANEIGRHVKMADLQDNMDLSRLITVLPGDVQRKAKYERALSILGAIGITPSSPHSPE